MSTESEIIKGFVSSALGDWRANLRRSDKGKLLECWQNVYTFLDQHPDWKGVLGLDVFAQRIVKLKAPPFDRGTVGPWTPDDDFELGLWLSARDGDERFVVKSKLTLVEGVQACGMRHKFHPVRKFLEGLTWDRKPRVDGWTAKYLGAVDSPYTQAVGRYFLLNMVARIFQPGCIMRSVMVLEGAQNRGKSTLLHNLAQPWFADTHFEVGSKDSFEVIQGVWLYEISEMESFTKPEATKVKQFVSSRRDNYRPPYERRAQQIERQVAFAGTTNDRQYLKDWTGNTRFWPLRCMEAGELLIDEIAEVREQLFAEVVDRLRQGERRHPTREEERDLFEPEQAARRPEHPWTPIIADWIDSPMAGGERRGQVTVTQVLKEALQFDAPRMTAAAQRDVGLILQHVLGWEHVRETKRGYRPRYYKRPPEVEEPPVGREPGSDDEPDSIPF